MVPFIQVDTDNNVISIIGLYPLNHKQVKRKMESAFEKLSILSDRAITISYPREPSLFLDSSRQVNVFEFLHNLIERTGFKRDLYFRSANPYAAECYDKWCYNNKIDKKIIVSNTTPAHYIRMIVSNNYYLLDTKKDKTLSLLVGSPRLQKQTVIEWYLKNISSTDLENNISSSFVIDNFSPEHWDNSLREKIKNLPGSFIDNTSIRRPNLTWNSNSKEIFNFHFSRSLFNFCVDYTEFEDFQNYSLYEDFKKQHSWWHEDMISEKPLMCCLFKQPFIRLGMPNSLKMLKDWGFRTYDGILFDESYDTIENFYDRAEHIFSQVMSYLEQPFESVYEKVYSSQVQEVVDHNYNLAMDIIKK